MPQPNRNHFPQLDSTARSETPIQRPLPSVAARTDRRALSLLEIIIALAVLTGSAALLAQLVDLGSHHAERAVEVTEAQVVAHNLLNEMILGTRAWAPSETFEPVDTWSRWSYRVQAQPLQMGRLIGVVLTVVERPDPGPNDTSRDTLLALDPTTSRRSYQLTRWLRADGELTSLLTEMQDSFGGDAGGRAIPRGDGATLP